MSDSKRLRLDAAKELRKSRNGGSLADKADNRKRAAAYKSLAENEDWLAGKDDGRQPIKEAQRCAGDRVSQQPGTQQEQQTHPEKKED